MTEKEKDFAGRRYMYHATTMDKLGDISLDGLKSNFDGVFLCKTPADCCKFLLMRGVMDILVCQVDLRKVDMSKIEESFDHSESFFQCRAWTYNDSIPPESISNYIAYKYD